MSLQEMRQALHELTNQFQVVLSAVELMEMDPLPADTKKKLRIAKVELKRSMMTLRRMQSIVDALSELEREAL